MSCTSHGAEGVRFKPGWEKHLNAERVSVSHDHELQRCLLKQTDVAFTSSYGRGCYIKLHVEIRLFDFISLIIKWLYVKNDERHLQIWGSTLHYHANPLSVTLLILTLAYPRHRLWLWKMQLLVSSFFGASLFLLTADCLKWPDFCSMTVWVNVFHYSAWISSKKLCNIDPYCASAR